MKSELQMRGLINLIDERIDEKLLDAKEEIIAELSSETPDEAEEEPDEETEDEIGPATKEYKKAMKKAGELPSGTEIPEDDMKVLQDSGSHDQIAKAQKASKKKVEETRARDKGFDNHGQEEEEESEEEDDDLSDYEE